MGLHNDFEIDGVQRELLTLPLYIENVCGLPSLLCGAGQCDE